MLFAPKEKGQGLVEYVHNQDEKSLFKIWTCVPKGLTKYILVLVAVVKIVMISLLGPAIVNIFQNIVDNI